MEGWLEWEVPALEELGGAGGAGDLYDLFARGVAPLRRGALAARHRLAGGHTGVRRQGRLRPLLLQGAGRGRFSRRSISERLRGRPRTHSASPASRPASLASGVPNGREEGGCSLSNYPTKHSRWETPSVSTPRRAPSCCSGRWRCGYAVDGAPEEGTPDPRAHRRRGDTLSSSRRSSSGEPQGGWTQALRGVVRAAPGELRVKVEEHWGAPPGELYVDGEEDRGVRARLRERLRRHPASQGVRGEPYRHLPRPRPPADAPLPRRLLVDHRGVRRRRHSTPRQTRNVGVAPGQVPGLSSACSPDATLRTCRCSIRSSSTTRARGRRPSGGRTRSWSTTSSPR